MTLDARTGSPPDWPQVRDELAGALERLSGLLAAVPDPDAHAVGVWTVAETAAHLAQVWAAMPLLAHRDRAGALAMMPGGDEELGTPSGSVFPDRAALSRWTRRGVEAEPERDLARLDERIRLHAAPVLAEGFADDGPRPWVIDGVRGGPVFFGCHLLGEVLVHGDDIARAGGLDWPLPSRAAALVLRCFMFEVIGQLLDTPAPGPPFYRVELHLAGLEPFQFVKDAGGMRVEPPSRRPADAHLRADPSALLAMIWERRSAVSLVARGQLLVWGRRPWRIRHLLAIAPNV